MFQIERWSEPTEVGNEDTEESEYDEVEKLARKKLSVRQQCQVAMGFLDNTLNRIVEHHIRNPPVSYPVANPQFGCLRSTEMEDTAVLMAIRNHGLVNTTETLTQSQTLCASRMSVGCSSDEPSCSSTRFPETDDPSITSVLGSSLISGGSWTEDKRDEIDRVEDFLERAIVEAIKIKGLSILSGD